MNRNRPVIIAAAILGLLAIGLTAMSMRGSGSGPGTQTAATPTPAPPAPHMVASVNIPPRTLMTAGMFHKKDIVGDNTPGMKAEDIIGQLAGDFIAKDAVITPAMLVKGIKRTKPANFAIPAGTRAIEVMIDKSQTTGDIVDVGDHVDVIVVHKLKAQDPVTKADFEFRSGRTIAQNLLVLATDPAIAQAVPTPAAAPVDPNAPPGTAPTPTPAPPPPPPGQPIPKLRVILAAPALEAERIAAAEEQGNIHLSIREPNDPELKPPSDSFEYPTFTNHPSAKQVAKTVDQIVKAFKPRTETTSYSPTPPPLFPYQPTVPPPAATPVAPLENEVTVIRGTEKTRVIVPQR